MKYSPRVFHVLALTIMMSSASAFDAAAADEPVLLNQSDLKWGPAPPTLPKGAQLAVLHGDPGKPGPFVMRLKMPAGYKLPPHWHSQAENLTIVSGTFHIGSGDKMDAGGANTMKGGGFHYLPERARHYAFVKEPTIVQVHGDGPFDITYVDPGDDPQKAAGK
jgi:hypothetical protein